MFPNFSLNSIFKSKSLVAFSALVLAASGMVALGASGAQAAGDCQATVTGGNVFDLRTKLEEGSLEIICIEGNFVVTSQIFSTVNRTNLTIKANSNATFTSAPSLDGLTVFVGIGGEGSGDIENLTLEGITFVGLSEGSVVGVVANNLTVKNSIFRDFYTADSGGAIYAQGFVTVDGSEFTSNRATLSGGAIAVDGGDLTVTDSTFTDNHAEDDYGGAIYVDEEGSGGELEVINSTFTSNTSSSGGGATYSYFDSTITDSTFNLNFTNSNGGAVSSANGDITVISSTFDSNDGMNGGAIFSPYTGTMSVENSTFIGNEATNEGGAIYSSYGQVSFSTFLNNLAPEPSGFDTPGNSIYQDCAQIQISANIFASTSTDPNLGYGGCAYQFEDLGGNLFSNLETNEPDTSPSAGQIYVPSQFGKSFSTIFGTSSPTLANNGGATQTIALFSGSLAIDFVAESGIGPMTTSLDQRGFARIGIPDAGSYEFGAVGEDGGDLSGGDSSSNTPTANAYTEKDLGSVYFAPGSSRLSNSAKKQIQALIAANPNSLYKVTGYVQKARTSRNDQRLSEARARAVEQYLVTLGAGTNFTVVIEAGKVPAKDGTKSTARRATLYSLTPVVK